ncbi:hypothetical protein D3C81_1979440 [compost metagenome]
MNVVTGTKLINKMPFTGVSSLMPVFQLMSAKRPAIRIMKLSSKPAEYTIWNDGACRMPSAVRDKTIAADVAVPKTQVSVE